MSDLETTDDETEIHTNDSLNISESEDSPDSETSLDLDEQSEDLKYSNKYKEKKRKQLRVSSSDDEDLSPSPISDVSFIQTVPKKKNNIEYSSDEDEIDQNVSSFKKVENNKSHNDDELMETVSKRTNLQSSSEDEFENILQQSMANISLKKKSSIHDDSRDSINKYNEKKTKQIIVSSSEDEDLNPIISSPINDESFIQTVPKKKINIIETSSDEDNVASVSQEDMQNIFSHNKNSRISFTDTNFKNSTLIDQNISLLKKGENEPHKDDEFFMETASKRTNIQSSEEEVGGISKQDMANISHKKKSIIYEDSRVFPKYISSSFNVINDSNESFPVSKRRTNSKLFLKDEIEDSACLPDVKCIIPDEKRISHDFRVFKNRPSAFTDSDTKNSTPKNSNTGKRLLNKSIETPKTFKQTKEIDTPRKVIQIIASSSEDSDGSEDVIDISDNEEDGPIYVPDKAIPESKLLKKINSEREIKVEQFEPSFIEVTLREHQEQSAKIKQIQTNLQRVSDLLKKINLEHLPDKGESLRIRAKTLEQSHIEEVMKLSKMKITQQNNPKNQATIPQPRLLQWNEIEAGASNVVPRTFGKQAMATINSERQLTMDRLQQLHGSLQTCPKETDITEQPKGLKVELMDHQKRALSWLLWRENQQPSGGILADDMGLGKTLTMISLLLKCNENKEDIDSEEDEENEEPQKKLKCKGGTLVVCPASLLNQWSGELEKRTKRGLLSCEVYHGPKRETKPKRLAQHDMVVTTYSIVNNEVEKNGSIFRVKWRRVIIDEAHQIRNHKSQTSEAVCRLSAKSRWALTGTPVQNKEGDMYALMKFLRCSPFDDLKVWKRWVGEKNNGGTERLHTVISSLMLRRTKVELIEKGLLNAMPSRTWELIPIDLTESERGVYSKILIFSRTLFAQFLHQRAEKNQDALAASENLNSANGPNHEYYLMRQKLLRLNKLKDIKQHEILVLLLRLRQICCHPSLITGMLNEDADMELLGTEEEQIDKASALDLLDQLNKLTLTDDHSNSTDNVQAGLEEASSLKDVANTVFKPSDPIFSKTRKSSKIQAMIELIKEKIIQNNDKAIIVSQWSSFLNLIGYHLEKEGFHFDQLDGRVPVNKRMEMVDRFNNPKSKIKILLLSLTAGGVGLNLVGANHLILLDLHWNPQLENQAQDRIYRVGQEKPVFVYKFLATDTIEKRILDLQEKKLDIANSMLTGSKQNNKTKLTLQDLKMLFEM